jgi:tripartite-type tricarboxylate transporter receptor subunit TctC
MSMTGAQFGKFIAAETEKWGNVMKFAGIKPE